MNNHLKKPCWTVYILRNERNMLYTGVTTDIDRRVGEHKSRLSRGARFTRACKALDLVYHCDIGDRGSALKVEARIKRLTKARKEMIVAAGLKKNELYAFIF